MQQGGMGQACWAMQVVFVWMGMGQSVKRLAYAPTLEDQRKAW